VSTGQSAWNRLEPALASPRTTRSGRRSGCRPTGRPASPSGVAGVADAAASLLDSVGADEESPILQPPATRRRMPPRTGTQARCSLCRATITRTPFEPPWHPGRPRRPPNRAEATSCPGNLMLHREPFRCLGSECSGQEERVCLPSVLGQTSSAPWARRPATGGSRHRQCHADCRPTKTCQGSAGTSRTGNPSPQRHDRADRGMCGRRRALRASFQPA
jgi:hypothetical protein